MLWLVFSKHADQTSPLWSSLSKEPCSKSILVYADAALQTFAVRRGFLLQPKQLIAAQSFFNRAVMNFNVHANRGLERVYWVYLELF